MSVSKGNRPKIAIVGAGNLGGALARSLRMAGYAVSEIVSRRGRLSLQRARALARRVGARAVLVEDTKIQADIVWLCVPDGEISACARSLRGISWKGKVALHSSGALNSDALAELRRRGARVAAVHPMMTFVAEVTPSLEGVGFALEGDRQAVRVARKIIVALGGEGFLIARKDKALYHAWGTFVSPLLTALLATSEQVAKKAGVPAPRVQRWAVPIVRQTVKNYARRGGARGVSGPIMRGDAATVRQHLQVLRALPEAREVYRALARAALETLPARNRKALKALLS